jgi:hypothetical protein
MIPCFSKKLTDTQIDRLIEFKIIENRDCKTTKFLHSIINIGTTAIYLSVKGNLYQISFSSGNFYPNIYHVYAWKHNPIYKPIDYYLFKKVDNIIKVTEYYSNLNKYRKLN